MKLIDYLGRKLKDDPMIRLLEEHDIEVIYRFDRQHENLPDEYTAAARNAGFELCFDESQRLKTIFCYVQSRDGFSVVDQSMVGATIFKSLAEAKATATRAGTTYEHKDEVQFLGRSMSWIRFEREGRQIHYEFSPTGLSMITLSGRLDGEVI
jgi:uncharacterized protein YjhX (UPF0386 family)